MHAEQTNKILQYTTFISQYFSEGIQLSIATVIIPIYLIEKGYSIQITTIVAGLHDTMDHQIHLWMVCRPLSKTRPETIRHIWWHHIINKSFSSHLHRSNIFTDTISDHPHNGALRCKSHRCICRFLGNRDNNKDRTRQTKWYDDVRSISRTCHRCIILIIYSKSIRLPIIISHSINSHSCPHHITPDNTLHQTNKHQTRHT